MSEHLRSKLKIAGRSISAALRLSIRFQLEKHESQVRSEKFDNVEGLLVALENLFYHGLKTNREISKLTQKRHPWAVLSSLFNNKPTFGIHIVESLSHIEDSFSKLRTWLKVLLINHGLVGVLSEIGQHRTELSRYYLKEALIISNEVTVIKNDAILLDRLQYSFDLKGHEDIYLGVPPIDYSFYIFMEKLLDTSVSSTGDCCSHPVDQRDQEILHLKDAHSRALEKANQLEKLLSERDNQLKFQSDALSASSQLRRDLECQVLELQIQVTLFHEQCVQELRKAGVTEIHLKPPTIKRWNDVSERRRHLVDQACSASSMQRGPGLPRCRDPAPCILNVDQGIDALTYQPSESSTRSISCSVLSGQSARSKIPVVTHERFRDEVEVGQEVDLELNFPSSARPTSSQCITDESVPPVTPSSSNIRITYSVEQQNDSHHRSRSGPGSPTHCESPIHLGIQQMPESGENFVLITDRLNPSTLSSAYSLNEVSTVGVNKYTRPFSDDAPFLLGNFLGPMRSSLVPPRSPSTLSSKKSPVQCGDHSLDRSPVADSNMPVESRAYENLPLSDHLQSTTLESQALIDSKTGDHQIDASVDFNSHDLANSNKDFYQLTSQSDEDFVSESEQGEKYSCTPHWPLCLPESSPNLSTKFIPTPSIQSVSSNLSTSSNVI